MMRWTKQGNWIEPLAKREPLPSEMETARRFYARARKSHLRKHGWFDDVTWTRCVEMAMGSGSTTKGVRS